VSASRLSGFPPVVWVAMALAAGDWMGMALPSHAPVAIVVAGLVATLVYASSRLRPTSRGVVLVAVTLAGCAQGAVVSRGESAGCRGTWKRGPQNATVQVRDAPGRRGIADADVLFGSGGCRGGPVRLRLDSGRVKSGATIVAVGVFESGGTLRVDRYRVLHRPRPWRFRIRDGLRARIQRLYGVRAPLVEAMVLGSRGDLDPQLQSRFVAAGLAHLLAISGLHVGILVTWVGLVLRRFWRRPAALAGGATVAWLYIALLGFPTAAVRAATFITVAALSLTRQRNPPLEAVIAVAMLVVVLSDPPAVRSVGAWLSVTAVWGAGAASRLVPRTLSGWRRGLLRLMASSVGATLATAPVSAFVFGQVAPVGVLANLPAIPLTALAVPAVFASLVVGSVLAAGGGLALAGLEAVSVHAAALPGGSVQGDPGVMTALPWVGILILTLWLLWRRPRWWVMWRRGALAAAVGAWLLAAIPAVASYRDRGELEIHVLDVGQGDALAVRTPGDRWVLIDGGPQVAGWNAGERVVLPFLRAHHTRDLAAVIVSHGDADHLGGVVPVVRAMHPGVALEPGQPLATDLYANFHGALDQTGTRWVAARTGDTVVIDSVVFAVLHPNERFMAARRGVNENSVVVRLSYRAFDAMLTGDAGWPAESVLVGTITPVEVLKVGHHGSATSTSTAWLDALRPQAAVISVGRANRYGHPARVVLDRLRARGIAVYRTDVDGTVTIRSDGRYFEIIRRPTRTFMERLRCILRMSLPSSDSSSSRSGCTRTPPGNSRTFSTTSP
jgi:competence protein ComEC